MPDNLIADIDQKHFTCDLDVKFRHVVFIFMWNVC